MSTLLEEYGLIGDGQTAALVSRRGAIDWLCLPRFDSDACLAALLGEERHGTWRIGPVAEGWRTTRRYLPDTLILQTEFARGRNAVLLTDFMPMRSGSPTVVRIARGIGGQVDCLFDLRLRFDYGLISPWLRECADGSVQGVVGPDLVTLRASVPVRVVDGRIAADFTVSAGQTITFTLTHSSSAKPAPAPLDPPKALAETEHFWRRWIGRFDRPTNWPTVTRRSLITLKALVHQPSGGLLAAPTTSLPEAIGGSLNWDYRYCWLRDATFTVGALLNAGYHDEAIAWRDWMLRALAGQPDKLRTMYRVDGGRHAEEREVPWLPGYEGSCPVRVGNGAANQEQTDIFGELIDALHLMRQAGIPNSEHGVRDRARAAGTTGADMAATRARLLGGSGRGAPLYLRQGNGLGRCRPVPSRRPAARGRLRCARAPSRASPADPRRSVRAWVRPCSRAFRRFLRGSHLDASLLLLAPMGFLPVNDPRMAATIEAIARDLTENGLVLRKPREQSPDEGAFLPCTCWLADVRAMQGRELEARRLLERVTGLANDVALLSEEYDTARKRLCGNFPQALSHLAVLNTTLGLSGPVLTARGRLASVAASFFPSPPALAGGEVG